MTKTELTKRLELSCGSPWATVNQIATVLHISKHTLKPYLAGLDYIPIGKSKRFMLVDVAERFIEKKLIQ